MSDKTYRGLVQECGKTPLTEGELAEKIKERFKGDGTALAISTDRVEFAKALDLDETYLKKALEVRVFTGEAELHALRGDLGCGFRCRYISDAEMEESYYLNETQFLDIADNTSGFCTSTGGGEFKLPEGFEKATSIKIRNYIEFDSEGLAQVVDFRIAGLE